MYIHTVTNTVKNYCIVNELKKYIYPNQPLKQKILLESAKSGYLNATSLWESVISNIGGFKQVDDEGMDFDDGSDAKTAICYYDNGGKNDPNSCGVKRESSRWTADIDVKNKNGAIRAMIFFVYNMHQFKTVDEIVFEDLKYDTYYFYIPSEEVYNIKHVHITFSKSTYGKPNRKVGKKGSKYWDYLVDFNTCVKESEYCCDVVDDYKLDNNLETFYA